MFKIVNFRLSHLVIFILSKKVSSSSFMKKKNYNIEYPIN